MNYFMGLKPDIKIRNLRGNIGCHWTDQRIAHKCSRGKHSGHWSWILVIQKEIVQLIYKKWEIYMYEYA